MAQGTGKKSLNNNLKKNKRNTALGPKRLGNRVVAPKNPKLIARMKMLKKHTSGTTAVTERNLAAKAGHLELLGGGKRDKKKEMAAAAAAAAKGGVKK